MTAVSPDEMFAFWRAAGPKKWFAKDKDFDRQIARRFLDTYEAAAAGRLSHWKADPAGSRWR